MFTEKANQVRQQSVVQLTNDTEHVIQLRDLLTEEISKSGDGPTRINGVSWLSRATLDMIGLAGECQAYSTMGAVILISKNRVQLQL